MTAIYDAQDALHTLVQGLTASDGWKVDLGFPQAANVQAKHIWVAGDVDDHTQTYGLSSAQAKDESFPLRVHVVATAKAKTYDVPRDRVKAVTDDLEAAILADDTLGGVVMQAEVTSIHVDDAQPSEAERQVMSTVTVTCRAWLT